MPLETFFQDLRIGLRVLIKERGCCALAVGGLALGICGVTTQFSRVNALALRGFNFPHADRIMGGGFRDPALPNGGLLLGLGAALILVQLGGANLQNFLFPAGPTDPTIYSSVAMLLIVVATAACLVPARRAKRVDPMTALRAE